MNVRKVADRCGVESTGGVYQRGDLRIGVE